MDSRALRIMKALHIENVTNPCSGNTQKIENKAVLPQPAYKSIKKGTSRNGEVWRPCPYKHDTQFKIIGASELTALKKEFCKRSLGNKPFSSHGISIKTTS
ncbi:unnamed protein product, partial [Nesidiocoris tenuis]